MNDNRIYEVGYLVLPTLPEDKVAAAVTSLKAALEKSNAIVISDENPRVTRLAYSIEKVIDNKKNKFDTAYFGWVKFELNPEKLAELEKSLKLAKELLRFLIIKTVRENIVVGRRPAAPTWTKKEEKAESTPPLTPASALELDKKIEELAI